MRFWQLVSTCRKRRDALKKVLEADEWEHFHEAYRKFDELVKRQQREILDEVAPDALVVSVLRQDATPLFLSEGHLRLRPLGNEDERTSVLNAYQKYGAEILEEVLEKGLVKVWR